MSLPGFDDWLTNQDRWYGMDDEPTDDQIMFWREMNDYLDGTYDNSKDSEDE